LSRETDLSGIDECVTLYKNAPCETGPRDLDELIDANRFSPLAATIAHAPGVLALPDHHGDRFDRILIGQALNEGLRLVARDQEIAKYPVLQIMV
jgi:PIN domain nuclease of toxin-antitoxin system